MSMSQSNQWYERLKTAGLVVLCAVAITSIQFPKLHQLKLSQLERSDLELEQEVAQETIALTLLKVLPDFGFDNLVGNWALIKFFIYFGDDVARETTGYSLAPQYFEIILNQDPRFIPAYFALSSSVSLYLGQPEFSVEMMQKGLESLSPQDPPRSYYIWRYLGVDQLLFLGDLPAAQSSFEQAADWGSKYSDEESKSIVTLSTSMAEFLSQKPNIRQAQFQAWIMVLLNATDDKVRRKAIENMEAIGGRVILAPDGTIQTLIPPQSP